MAKKKKGIDTSKVIESVNLLEVKNQCIDYKMNFIFTRKQDTYADVYTYLVTYTDGTNDIVKVFKEEEIDFLNSYVEDKKKEESDKSENSPEEDRTGLLILTREHQFSGSKSVIKVIVDGEETEPIKSGESKKYLVAYGNHELILKMFLTKTKFNFTINDEHPQEVIRFRLNTFNEAVKL